MNILFASILMPLCLLLGIIQIKNDHKNIEKFLQNLNADLPWLASLCIKTGEHERTGIVKIKGSAVVLSITLYENTEITLKFTIKSCSLII